MRLQCEVSRVKHVRLDVLEVAAIWRSPLCRKDVVILSPHNQGWRLKFPEELLEGWIERKIRPVVIEQVQLDLVVPGTIQSKLVKRPGSRIDQACIADSVLILPLRRRYFGQEVNRLAVFLRWLVPILFDRVPEGQQSFILRIAILNDKCLHSLRVT
jgi:hypothetical protein